MVNFTHPFHPLLHHLQHSVSLYNVKWWFKKESWISDWIYEPLSMLIFKMDHFGYEIWLARLIWNSMTMISKYRYMNNVMLNTICSVWNKYLTWWKESLIQTLIQPWQKDSLIQMLTQPSPKDSLIQALTQPWPKDSIIKALTWSMTYRFTVSSTDSAKTKRFTDSNADSAMTKRFTDSSTDSLNERRVNLSYDQKMNWFQHLFHHYITCLNERECYVGWVMNNS